MFNFSIDDISEEKPEFFKTYIEAIFLDKKHGVEFLSDIFHHFYDYLNNQVKYYAESMGKEIYVEKSNNILQYDISYNSKSMSCKLYNEYREKIQILDAYMQALCKLKEEIKILSIKLEQVLESSFTEFSIFLRDTINRSNFSKQQVYVYHYLYNNIHKKIKSCNDKISNMYNDVSLYISAELLNEARQYEEKLHLLDVYSNYIMVKGDCLAESFIDKNYLNNIKAEEVVEFSNVDLNNSEFKTSFKRKYSNDNDLYVEDEIDKKKVKFSNKEQYSNSFTYAIKRKYSEDYFKSNYSDSPVNGGFFVNNDININDEISRKKVKLEFDSVPSKPNYISNYFV